MNGWRRLNKDNLDKANQGEIFIARRGDGKLCVGFIGRFSERNVLVMNGDYEVLLWYNEPRMFTTVPVPTIPEVTVADPQFKV